MASILYVFALTVATLAILGSAQRSQYCNLQSCPGGTHTLCKYPFLKISRNCGKVLSSGLTRAEMRQILDLHNTLRQRVASGAEKRGNPGPQPPAKYMPSLKWSKELADIAQTWVNQCQPGHDKCKHTANMMVGQNYASWPFYGSSPMTLTDLVQKWYDEVDKFDRNGVKSFEFSFLSTSGHYTQMVWAETTQIGCGAIRYKNEEWAQVLLVCNYGPAGNWAGRSIYETR